MTKRTTMVGWPTASRDRDLARLVFDAKTLADLGIDASALQQPASFAGKPAVLSSGDLVAIMLPDGREFQVASPVAELVEALEKQLEQMRAEADPDLRDIEVAADELARRRAQPRKEGA